MSSFNDLPYELHERIIIDALYCTYTDLEIDSALENESKLSAGLACASIKLGQRTLKALKHTSRRMYIEAAKASRIWLDYETLDLFEELETIIEKLYNHAIDCGSQTRFHSTVSSIDRCRCFWISKMEIRTVCLYKRRLDEAELRTWKRLRRTLTGTESIEGFCDFMAMVEQHDISQGECTKFSPHLQRRCGQSRREKLLTVRLNFVDEGPFVDVGPDAIYTPGEDRPDSILAKWKRQRTLPDFYYGFSLLQWYRPSRSREVFQTLQEGLVRWENRIIRDYGMMSEEYERFVKFCIVQKMNQLACVRLPRKRRNRHLCHGKEVLERVCQRSQGARTILIAPPLWRGV